MNTASFQLNGQAVSVSADANASLVHLLRNPCDAKEVRYGCGAGNCGACTVMVDGVAQQSCNTPNWSVEGRDVRTPASLPQDPVGLWCCKPLWTSKPRSVAIASTAC